MIRSAFLTLTTLVFLVLSCTCALANYSILINKATNRLTLYDNNQAVKTFPVATGKNPRLTPEGNFTIVNKLVNPYYVKKGIPGGSPRNPLGPRWLGLSCGGGGEYGIHGNNDPSSIGKYVSAGCIRLKNEDIIWLFDRVPVGTPVKIINLPATTKTLPATNYTVFVDGRALSLSSGEKPMAFGGTCLVPVRPAIEAMGYSGTWVESEGRFDIKVGRCTVSVWDSSNLAAVDNHSILLPARSVITKGGSLCVHPDFFSVAMGGKAYLEGKGNIKIISPVGLLAGSGFIIPPPE